MKNLVLALILSALVFGERARGAEEDFFAILNKGYKGKIVDNMKMTANGEAIFTSSDTIEPAPCIFDEGAETTEGSRINEVPLNNTDIDILDESNLSEAVHCLDGVKDGSSAKRLLEKGLKSNKRPKRNIRKPIDTYRWPSTTIYYKYNYGTSVPSGLKEKVNEAVEEYKRYTCINFKESSTQKPFLSIIDDKGCYSYIGYVTNMANSNNGQKVSLSSGCYYDKTTPIHEFFHALGSFHQHNRPDRDTYLTVDLSQVPSENRHNFDKLTSAKAERFGTPYSYRSIMHYPGVSFGGSQSLTTKDPNFQYVIGQAPTFSFEDLYIINKFYRCDSECAGANTCQSPSGLSYRGKDCKCYCDNDDKNPDVPAVLCSASPLCTKIGQPCGCSQNINACVNLKNSYCQENSNACQCGEDSLEINNECYKFSWGLRRRSVVAAAPSGISSDTVADNKPIFDGSGYSSEGIATIPMNHSKLQSRFENDGVSMYAVGKSDESAGIETPTLGPGTWCVQFSANVNDGAVAVDRSKDDFANYRYAGFYNIGRTTTWHPQSYKFTSSTPDYKIRIRGYMPEAIAKHETDAWSLRVKDIKVYKCKP